MGHATGNRNSYRENQRGKDRRSSTPMRRFLWLLLPLVAQALSTPTRAVLPAQPDAADLDAAKAAGALRLWSSFRPRARQVAAWELKLFFEQEGDDMDRQLGMRSTADADRTNSGIAMVAVSGVLTASTLLASPEPVLQRAGGVAALVPFAALGAATLLPEPTQRALVTLWRLDPAYRRRQTYHEAGHFLCGYLVGLEVESYAAATGAGASSAVRFRSLPGRTHDVLDRLAVVSMAGIAAEVIACGDAQGGTADVAGVRELFERATPRVSSRLQQDDRIRWATLFALTLLQQHRASLDAVAGAFDEDVCVGECIHAAEQAMPPKPE
jgi:hypothetical protein